MAGLIKLENGEVIDLRQYPLPDGIQDELYNIPLMATAMNVSTFTVIKWINAGMPVEQRGGNGRFYELRFSHCYAWRIWREQRAQKETAAKASNAVQKALLFMGEDADARSQAPLSAKEIRVLAEAILALGEAASLRGEFLLRSDVQELVSKLLGTFCSDVTNLPDWIAQEFSLSSQQVDR